MLTLIINAGSSTVRFELYARHKEHHELLSKLSLPNAHQPSHAPLQELLENHNLADLTTVIHRFVHGGTSFNAACHVTPSIRKELEALSQLAPLHNPLALAWLDVATDSTGESTRQIAVFDTALYHALPEYASTYGLPHKLARTLSLRRFGFHGFAHAAMFQRATAVIGSSACKRVITLQLGSGCSMTAFLDGRAVDTSMGFSPLEGLLMATRPGDLDAGVLLQLQKEEHLSTRELEQLLYYDSGLKGISGISGDMRELLRSSEQQSLLAIETYCYRIRKYLGAYLAALGGADAIIFGGGVGENAPPIREKIISHFAWCGIALDDQRNRATVGEECRVSRDDSSVSVFVTTVDEAKEMLRQAQAFFD